MRENEFEKQVQKQLEDFQLNPSASVWENVEDQIRKKKRRRVVFYILLPAALVLLGYLTNYFLFTGSKTESDSPEVTKDRMTQQPFPVKNERLLTTDKTNTASQEKEKSIITQPQEINKTDGSAEKEIPQNQKTSSVVKNNRPPVSKDLLIIEVKERSAIKHNDDASLQKESDDSPVINNNAPAKQDVVTVMDKPVTEADKKITIDQNTTEETKTQKDIVVAEKDPVITKTDSILKESPADNKDEAIAKKPVHRGGKTAKFKINWGIDLSAGLTSNHTSIFSLDKSYAADVYSSPGNSTGGGIPVINPPSSVSSGPAFKIGIAGEMQISERSRFSTGLQYAYVNNRIKTGAKQDTTIQVQADNFSSTIRVNGIYRGTQQNNYANSYHFIQIPVWYHLQINKGEKLPIQWNVGASFGYMFATNALVYNSGYSGIYYRDKDAFTKTHFNLGTGLSFRLKSKNRMEWVIGPELSFDMSPLMKNGNKQYLLYGGIDTKLFFLKKKNK